MTQHDSSQCQKFFFCPIYSNHMLPQLIRASPFLSHLMGCSEVTEVTEAWIAHRNWSSRSYNILQLIRFPIAFAYGTWQFFAQREMMPQKTKKTMLSSKRSDILLFSWRFPQALQIQDVHSTLSQWVWDLILASKDLLAQVRNWLCICCACSSICLKENVFDNLWE